MPDLPDVRRAAAARDAAVLRTRQLTAAALAAAAVLAALFSALAAGATHLRAHARQRVVAARVKPGPIVAPAAPLVGVQQPSTAVAAPPAGAPVQAPVTTPPVASSGGS